MSCWNGVLESLHSSLIDTLIERFPKFKPELGLPIRRDAWGSLQDVTHLVVGELICNQQRAVVAIGLNEAARKTSEQASSAIRLNILMRRAEPDFKRRGLSVTLGKEVFQNADSALPETFLTPTRVIWIPLRILQKTDTLVFHLGIGI